jgi:hypothetical protein
MLPRLASNSWCQSPPASGSRRSLRPSLTTEGLWAGKWQVTDGPWGWEPWLVHWLRLIWRPF